MKTRPMIEITRGLVSFRLLLDRWLTTHDNQCRLDCTVGHINEGGEVVYQTIPFTYAEFDMARNRAVKERDEAEKTPEIELTLENGTPWRLSLDRFVRLLDLGGGKCVVVTTPAEGSPVQGCDVLAMSYAEAQAAVDRARGLAPPAPAAPRFVDIGGGCFVRPDRVDAVSESGNRFCNVDIGGGNLRYLIARPAADVLADLERALAAR